MYKVTWIITLWHVIQIIWSWIFWLIAAQIQFFSVKFFIAGSFRRTRELSSFIARDRIVEDRSMVYRWIFRRSWKARTPSSLCWTPCTRKTISESDNPSALVTVEQRLWSSISLRSILEIEWQCGWKPTITCASAIQNKIGAIITTRFA